MSDGFDNEIATDDLLLPALDVYVWEEGKGEHLIPFKPTHPDVSFHCSRKTNNHMIEVSSL